MEITMMRENINLSDDYILKRSKNQNQQLIYKQFLFIFNVCLATSVSLSEGYSMDTDDLFAQGSPPTSSNISVKKRKAAEVSNGTIEEKQAKKQKINDSCEDSSSDEEESQSSQGKFKFETDNLSEE